MKKSTFLQVRINEETKADAERLAERIGINVSELVRLLIESATLDIEEKYSREKIEVDYKLKSNLLNRIEATKKNLIRGNVRSKGSSVRAK